MKGRYVALTLLAGLAGLGGGVAIERFALAPPAADAEGGRAILYWVAPMDPNFRRDGPGKSPMGMDLIPVYEGDDAQGPPGEIALSPVEINAIGVRTTVARTEALAPRIETVGFVGYNEHLTRHIHTRTDGWIETVGVRAAGDPVRAGDLLFEMYAPEILIAVSELRRGIERRSAIEIEAAVGKLRNYDMSARQLAQLRRTPGASDRLRVYAPQDGVVVALAAREGMYVGPETEALTITDLSSVWLLADVFERDLGRLTADMEAEARVDHLPGRVFTGTIDYITPELDPTTRTLPVRLRFENPNLLLRPNMFAEVTLIGRAGRRAVTVPTEAVIRTGRAERVILALPDGRFRPRLVTTGRTGVGRTEIVQGLEAGDRVVASAQFLIDSESSLAAGFLRMAPTDAAPATGTGTLTALDAEARTATIRHAAIAELDWPAMTTRFALAAGVPAASEPLEPGAEVRFELSRGADGTLALLALGPDDGIDAVGTAVIRSVDAAAGTVTLSHDPIPALGWPAMTMDLPLGPGVDPAAVPIDSPVEIDLAKAGGALYQITAVRATEAAQPAAAIDDHLADRAHGSHGTHGTHGNHGDRGAGAAAAPAPILVAGTIEALDPAARTATIRHDDIVEIGMPGMTMAFAVTDDLDLADLPIGERVRLRFERQGPMRLVLGGIDRDPPIRVAGVVNRVDPAARTANISHDDIVEIGMPGMTMDFPVAASVDLDAVPLGARARIGLRQGAAMALEVVSIDLEPDTGS